MDAFDRALRQFDLMREGVSGLSADRRAEYRKTIRTIWLGTTILALVIVACALGGILAALG